MKRYCHRQAWPGQRLGQQDEGDGELFWAHAPLERTNLSRLKYSQLLGEYFMTYLYRAMPIAAIPMADLVRVSLRQGEGPEGGE